MLETGENQKRAKRVPLPLGGREKQEAGRRNHGAGECLLQDLGYLELEETVAGERQFVSVPVALPKAGVASLRMGPVVTLQQGAWALGVAQAQ